VSTYSNRSLPTTSKYGGVGLYSISAVAEVLADVCEHYSEAVKGTSSQMLTTWYYVNQPHITHSMISFDP